VEGIGLRGELDRLMKINIGFEEKNGIKKKMNEVHCHFYSPALSLILELTANVSFQFQ
jgi:hypothetical protein